VLIVEEAIKKQEERKAKEQQVMQDKERATALRAKSRLCKDCLEGAPYGF
jgi:hypothetical protein